MSSQATIPEDFHERFPVYVSQRIGDIRVGEFGYSPVRAVLDLVGRHAENLMEGERGEYHATVLGQPITVVVAVDKVEAD